MKNTLGNNYAVLPRSAGLVYCQTLVIRQIKHSVIEQDVFPYLGITVPKYIKITPMRNIPAKQFIAVSVGNKSKTDIIKDYEKIYGTDLYERACRALGHNLDAINHACILPAADAALFAQHLREVKQPFTYIPMQHLEAHGIPAEYSEPIIPHSRRKPKLYKGIALYNEHLKEYEPRDRVLAYFKGFINSEEYRWRCMGQQIRAQNRAMRRIDDEEGGVV